MSEKRGCACFKPLVASLLMVIIGIALALLSIGASPLYKSMVKKKLVMKHGSTTYEDWNHAPLPIFMTYYVFNYTNVEAIINNNSKPNVTQLGPYTYREDRLNYILEEDSDNIIYMQNYTYTFDEEASCKHCTENDTFFTPNIPYITVLRVLASANVTENGTDTKKGAIKFFNAIFKALHVQVFEERTVSELLWGFNDTFLVNLQSQAKQAESLFHTLNITMPEISTFVALQHNGTVEADFFGNFTLLTGNKNIDDLQRITHWKGKTDVPYWLTNYSRMINGTDGTHFKPFVGKGDKLYTFIPDICRSLYLTYDQNDKTHDIDLYRFTTPDELFYTPEKNPDNKAFCLGGCWPQGIMPIGQCLEGNPPAFASGVHFYQSDPELFKAIDGLEEPDKEKHATLISVEPDTGTTMKANKRLQINIRAKKIPLMPQTDMFSVNGTFLPVFYVDESVRLDKKNADKFKDEVTNPKKDLLVYGKYSLIGVGAGFVLIGGIIYLVYFIRSKDANPHERFDKSGKSI